MGRVIRSGRAAMRWFGRAKGEKGTLRAATPMRLVSVLAGGTLGQRAVAVIGLVLMAYAIMESLVWVAMLLGGFLLCFFAVRDYERTHEP